MKFLKITQDAKTEHGNYYAGEHRKVDDRQAKDLLQKGWAVEPKAVRLDVQSARLGVQTEDI